MRSTRFHLVYTNVTMVTWSDLVLLTVDIRTISTLYQHVNGYFMLVYMIHLAIIVKETDSQPYNASLGEQTLFYNLLTDLYCLELHCCLENVTPSHHCYFEFL